MALAGYTDFVVVADRAQAGAGGAVASFDVRVLDSSAGQGEAAERVQLPHNLARARSDLDHRRLDTQPPAQIDLGEALGTMLLPPGARTLFNASLAALPADTGLRVRLRLDDALVDLPWEYAWVQSHHGERDVAGFLGLDPRVSLVRHEAMAGAPPPAASPARRVVVAMATPPPHDRYPLLASLPGEQRTMKAALAAVPGVSATWLPDYGDASDAAVPGATLAGLLHSIIGGADVVHFSGHGEFDTEMGPALGSVVGQGAVVLADEAGQAAVVPAQRLAEVLVAKGVGLAVLSACETGQRDGRNVWSGVAASLLRAGVPAVVGMQFTVNDAAAAAFAGALYSALVAGLTIDEAVALGRTAIRVALLATSNPDGRDWGSPVLYLRHAGGRVFAPVADPVAADQALAASARLIEVRQKVGLVSAGGRAVGATVGDAVTGGVTVVQEVTTVGPGGTAVGAVIGGDPGEPPPPARPKG